MAKQQVEEEIDVALFLKHFYDKRGLIFRVFILAILLSLAYSSVAFMLNPPTYQYTSQSVIDMTISEEADYQKSMFISYLDSRKIFEESAKSLEMVADYKIWRDAIVIESISGSNQIIFKMTSADTNKLVELNRRIVSNAIFQSSNILTGINIQTLEEAILLDNVQEVRANIDFLGNFLLFSTLGLFSVFGWLTFEVITDKKIKRVKDIQGITGLLVIGTIPDFEKLTVTEEVSLSNFLRGLIWKKKK